MRLIWFPQKASVAPNTSAVGFLNEPDVHNIGQFGQNRQPFLERFDDFAKSSSKNTSKLFNCNK